MINEIKTIVANYLNNAKLTQLAIGTVETVNPLTIRLNDKLTVPKEFLYIPTWLRENSQETKSEKVDMQISTNEHSHSVSDKVHTHNVQIEAESVGTDSNTHNHDLETIAHTHDITGETEHTHKLYVGLKIGDKVYMMRDHGGQKFFILDVIRE